MLDDPTERARLILLRHPELGSGQKDAAMGQLDGELSRRGMQHTVAVLRLLAGVNIDAIFSSPAKHCIAASEALSKDRGLPVQIEPRLLDQTLGEWEGQAWADLKKEHEARVREFFHDYGLIAPPEGETLSDAVDRTLGWWNDTAADLEGQTALVVSAAPLLSGFAARLLGLSIRRAPALALPAAGVGMLDVYRDGAVVRCWHPLCLDDNLP